MTISRPIFRWSLVIIWASFMWFLSAQPNLSSGLKEDFLLRKIAHVTEYAILTGLLIRAFSLNLAATTAVWTAAVVAVGYASTDEWHQTFVQGRHGTWHDVLIDSIGIVVVCVIVWRINQKKTALS